MDELRVTEALRATLRSLSAPDLAAAAVRALRTGLRIPPPLAPPAGATPA